MPDEFLLRASNQQPFGVQSRPLFLLHHSGSDPGGASAIRTRRLGVLIERDRPLLTAFTLEKSFHHAHHFELVSFASAKVGLSEGRVIANLAAHGLCLQLGRVQHFLLHFFANFERFKAFFFLFPIEIVYKMLVDAFQVFNAFYSLFSEFFASRSDAADFRFFLFGRLFFEQFRDFGLTIRDFLALPFPLRYVIRRRFFDRFAFKS